MNKNTALFFMLLMIVGLTIGIYVTQQQTRTSPKAAGVCSDAEANLVFPPPTPNAAQAGNHYTWISDCAGPTCTQSTECPKNSLQLDVNPATSAGCFPFSNGSHCIALVYSVNQPNFTQLRAAAPTAAPTTAPAPGAANCADSAWRPNGGSGPSDYSACGSPPFSAPFGEGMCQASTDPIVNGKYFLCKKNPTNPLVPNDFNWFGPCNTQADCQAAQVKAGFPAGGPVSPLPTTAPGLPTPTNPPGGPLPVPTTAPVNPGGSGATCLQRTGVPCNATVCSQWTFGGVNNEFATWVNKYFSCEKRAIDTQPVWYGPCDTYYQCTNSLPPTPPPPTVAPTPVTTVNSTIQFRINIGTDPNNAVSLQNPGQLAIDLKLNGTAFPLKPYDNIIKHTLGIPLKDIKDSSLNPPYYQNFHIPVSFDIPATLSQQITNLSLHVYSTKNLSPTAQAIPFCKGALQTINQTITITDSITIQTFLRRYNSTAIAITLNCQGVATLTSVPTYTREDLRNIIDGYLVGKYSPQQTSVALVNFDHKLGLHTQPCDAPIGECTANFGQNTPL